MSQGAGTETVSMDGSCGEEDDIPTSRTPAVLTGDGADPSLNVPSALQGGFLHFTLAAT